MGTEPMNYYDVVFTIVSSSAVRASSPEKKKSPMGPFYYFEVVLFESLPPFPHASRVFFLF